MIQLYQKFFIICHKFIIRLLKSFDIYPKVLHYKAYCNEKHFDGIEKLMTIVIYSNF